jgi:hypothetical protein
MYDQDLSFLKLNQQKMGIERTGENQPTSKMEDAKVFLKEIWQSTPVKVLLICFAGAAVIFVGGKLCYLAGDSIRGYRYMKDSWLGKTAPPLIK